MGRGFIKIHRELMDHPVFAHDGIFRLWTYCLMRANWKDTNWMIPGTATPVLVKRGQFITGRESLHSELYGTRYNGSQSEKPDPRTVWRWLDYLKNFECINTANLSNRGTLVTICNYDTYQDSDSDNCPTETNITPRKIIVSNRFSEQEHNSASSCESINDLASNQKDRLSDVLSTTYCESDGGSCPTGVQPVSNRCPTGVQPVSTNKETKKLRTNTPVGIQDVTFPAVMDTPEVRRALAEWLDYKRVRGEGYKKASFVNHLLASFSQYGPVAFTQSVSQAIGNNYAGIVKPKGSVGVPQNPITPPKSSPPVPARIKPALFVTDPYSERAS